MGRRAGTRARAACGAHLVLDVWGDVWPTGAAIRDEGQRVDDEHEGVRGAVEVADAALLGAGEAHGGRSFEEDIGVPAEQNGEDVLQRHLQVQGEGMQACRHTAALHRGSSRAHAGRQKTGGGSKAGGGRQWPLPPGRPCWLTGKWCRRPSGRMEYSSVLESARSGLGPSV